MPHYKLNDDHSVSECSLEELVEVYNDNDKKRILGKDVVCGVMISTIFLGIDHNFGDGPPIIFETMVFGGVAPNSEQERYSTYDEAMAGHKRYVKKYSGFWMKIRLYAKVIFNF